MTGVGHRGGVDVRLRGRDDGRRAGETQVSTIVVEALHFPFAGIWDGLALIYVWQCGGVKNKIDLAKLGKWLMELSGTLPLQWPV